MASLKDLRNRIASTKATQKITKAMQMVAASKLRRAQAAALAARPYAEHMDKVLGNIAAAVTDLGSRAAAARRHRHATRCICSSCARPSAACAARSTRRSCRLARERANALIAEGKEVKFLCVGRKGYEQLRRLFAKQIIEHDRSARARARIGFEHAADDRREDHRAVRSGRVRRLHPVLLALQVGDRADPDRAADHPADASPRRRRTARSAAYEYEPDELDILAELLPRNIAVQVFRALLENAASFTARR